MIDLSSRSSPELWETDMSQVNVQRAVQRTEHARALLSGGLGVFASLLAIGWALFAYNLPSAVDLTTKMSQNLMLLQFGVAFVTLLGSGLMLARYTAAGGPLNIIGSLSTFITGIYYSSGLEAAARAKDLTTLHLRFSQYFTGTVNIPTDRIVSTLLIVPVFPIAVLLLISGLGAMATYRAGKKPMLLPQK